MKRLILILTALSVLFVFSGCSSSDQTPGEETPEYNEEAQGEKKPENTEEAQGEEAQGESCESDFISVYHAGGAIDGLEGSNCLEAINSSCAAGYQYLELDFCWTSDAALVCIHDWGARFSSDITEGVALSLESFLQIQIYDQYTPLSLDMLAEWLVNNSEVQIITDVKQDNLAALTLLAQAYPELRERFIVQIYGYDEYEPVSALGFENIILTLYNMTYEEKTNATALAEFAAEHRLWSITFNNVLIDWLGQDYVDTLATAGTRLLVHTVNDEEEIAYYLSFGVDGVYRDY